MKNTPIPFSLSTHLLRRRTLFALAVVALLPACGGGGGGSGAAAVSAPTIATTPVSQTLSTASAASFSVSASGSAPLTYQWLKDGKEIPGATSPSYTIGKVQLADNDSKWQVVVKNSVGSVTSSAATLRVTGIEVYAGSLDESGYTNGSREIARLASPKGLVFDAADNLYIAESNSSSIRKITPQGQVSFFAASGTSTLYTDKPTYAHLFLDLGTLTRTPDGSLLIADSQTIRKLTLDGVLTNLGSVPMGINGDGRGVGFTKPSGIALDKDGNWYAANGVGTRKVNAQGRVTILDGVDTEDNVMGTRFYSPRGIALDSKGNLLRFDLFGQITRTSPDGVVTVLHKNKPDGSQPSFGSNFFVVDKNDDLIVLDRAGLLRKVAKDGTITTLAGNGPIVGDAVVKNGVMLGALPGRLGYTQGLAIDSKGALYLSVDYAILKVVY